METVNNPYLRKTEADNYDSSLERPVIRNFREQEKNAIYSVLNNTLKKNYEILEIGSGTGFYTLEIAERVKSVLAVEPSKSMTYFLEQKINIKNVKNISILNKSFSEYSGKQIFDYVIAIGVLDYVQNWKLFIEKALELARKGVILTMPSNSFLGQLFWLTSKFHGINVYRYNQKDLREYLKKYKLKILETGGKTKITRGLTLVLIIEKY